MYNLVPLLVFRGMNLACQASVFIGFWVLLITNTEDQNGSKPNQSEDEKIAIAMKTYVTLGFGMAFGPQLMGILLDKYGHRASIIYILSCTILIGILLILQNELQHFNYLLANLTMFGLGLVENCLDSYITIVSGAEFESKIDASAARHFIGSGAIFIFLASLAIWPLETKADYRPFYIFFLLIGILSQIQILRICHKFKKWMNG